MDVDFCLFCEKHLSYETHFEDLGPYCSFECQHQAGPSTSSPVCYEPSLSSNEEGYYEEDEEYYHSAEDVSKTHWVEAWAADVPYGAPAPASWNDDDTWLRSSTQPSLAPRACPSPPALLRPVPPSLCMTTPQPARMQLSLPVVTPQQQIAALSMNHSADSGSMGKTSLLSTQATPVSSPVPISPVNQLPSVLESIANRVASWVAPSHLPSPPPPNNSSSQPLGEDYTNDKPSGWWSPCTTMSRSPMKTSLKQVRETPKSYRRSLELPSHPVHRGRRLSRAVA